MIDDRFDQLTCSTNAFFSKETLATEINRILYLDDCTTLCTKLLINNPTSSTLFKSLNRKEEEEEEEEIKNHFKKQTTER